MAEVLAESLGLGHPGGEAAQRGDDPGFLRCVLRRQRVEVGALTAALLVPLLVLGVGLRGARAPLSTHDGAFHVETSDAFRRGVVSRTLLALMSLLYAGFAGLVFALHLTR